MTRIRTIIKQSYGKMIISRFIKVSSIYMKIPVIALDMIPGNIFSTKRYESEKLEVRKLKIRTGRMYIQRGLSH